MPAMGQRSDARLGEARALVAQGEQRRALDSLERTREAALAEKRLDVLEEALELAVELRDRTRGRLRFAYGSLAHSTVQNIRFLTRQQALERGEPWVDPAPAAQAAPGPPAPARSPIESEGASTSPSHELVSRLE